jgi:hypothetical protein
VLRRVAKFVGQTSAPRKPEWWRALGANGVVRRSTARGRQPKSTKALLDAFYQPHNQALLALLSSFRFAQTRVAAVAEEMAVEGWG